MSSRTGHHPAIALHNRVYRDSPLQRLTAQLTAVERRFGEIDVLPFQHAARAQLPALQAERDSLKLQIDAELARIDADFAARSAGHAAYVTQRTDLENQIREIERKIFDFSPLPAAHPANKSIPALEAQRAELQAQLAALIDPGYDLS